MLPLSLAPKGKPMVIGKVKIERRTKSHLANMGLYEGAKIVLLTEDCGVATVSAKGSRITVDRATASKIYVSSIEK